MAEYGSGGKCFTCKQPITAHFKEALNRMFHPECLKCCNCKDPVDASSLKTNQNKIYCYPCHAKLFMPRCIRCNKPIHPEELIDVRGKKFHQGCFCCNGCLKPMSPGRHFLIESHLYCEIECALKKKNREAEAQAGAPAGT